MDEKENESKHGKKLVVLPTPVLYLLEAVMLKDYDRKIKNATYALDYAERNGLVRRKGKIRPGGGGEHNMPVVLTHKGRKVVDRLEF
jgi:hypothetical protein